MKTHELFSNFLNNIKEIVSPSIYAIWFDKLELINIEGNVVNIKVPLKTAKTILKDNYIDIIEETFFSLTGINYNFNFLTEDEIDSKNDILNIEETSKTNENTNNNVEWNTNLNPNLNFDNYLVGESNRLAYISAMNVAQTPGNIRNPFFIYGRSGVGKTHLMHAIGNYIVNNSDKKVLFTSSETFKDEYANISKLEKGKEALEYANNFKNKYRNVDVLIIDDIQFLVGAEKTQTEFFHTFESLHQANKQIIISSDSSPNDLKKIEDRLKSRFTLGLPVDIHPPDFELKCEIIKQKLELYEVKNKITKDVIEYIANASNNDVRYLEGTIKRLLAYTALMNPEKIDLDFAIEGLNDYLNYNFYQENTISNIQKVVADYFKITVDDLKSKKRSSNIARPRQIAMYLCRMETDEILERIGLEFGGKNYSTVIASYEKIKKELKNNKSLELMLKEIKDKL